MNYNILRHEMADEFGKYYLKVPLNIIRDFLYIIYYLNQIIIKKTLILNIYSPFVTLSLAT